MHSFLKIPNKWKAYKNLSRKRHKNQQLMECKKKREIVIIKKRTDTGTITELYKSGIGYYVPYSQFKELEKQIVKTKYKVYKTEYFVNGKMVNSLRDCINYVKKEERGENNDKIEKSTSTLNEIQIKKEDTNITTLGIKDFVIRRNVFKCMNKSHKLKNIDAEIVVTSRIGTERVILFSAGYCDNCRLYFIMESTYQHLKKYGAINCQVSDEKTYISSVTANGMILAQESILRQYGYTVSQEFDLLEITRRKILANLIDNKIMTKSEIISYLDFFISQHISAKYQIAVGKWELDRDFVREYNIGKYTKYGVGGIRR